MPPFLPGTAGVLGGCHRSAKAWPVRLHRAGAAVGVPRRFTFAACSGADIGDLRRARRGAPAQLARLGPDVALVTITIGGNDAGFRRVLSACVVTTTCRRTEERRTRRELAALRPALASLLREIRRRTSPRARIVVVGYPRIFPAAAPVGPCEGIASRDVAWLDATARRLGDTVRAATRDARSGIELVDLAAAFRGHDVCRPERVRWVTGLDLGRPSWSFHPNAAGHRRIAALVRAHLAR